MVLSQKYRSYRISCAGADQSGLRIASGLSVAGAGFSLHAATTAAADDVRAPDAAAERQELVLSEALGQAAVAGEDEQQ